MVATGGRAGQSRAPKRSQAETSSTTTTGPDSSKRTAIATSSSSSSSSSSASVPTTATTSAGIEESLDDLHFEDEFEDEFDDEEERLKELIKRRETKKRQRAAQKQQRTQQGEVKGEEEVKGEAGMQVEEQEEEEEDDEEEYNEESSEEEEAGEDEVRMEAEESKADATAVKKSSAAEKKKGTAANTTAKSVWRPSDGVEGDEGLEFDSTAYAMLHRMKVEWPCLSFDLIPDSLGACRTKFPHTVYLVAGTQADQKNKNQLQLMKIKDMHKTKHDDEDDSDEEEDEGEEPEGVKHIKDEEDEDESEDEDNLDDDPIPEVRSVQHSGAVNRVKVNPLAPHLVATQSDTGKAHIFDLTYQLSALDAPPATLHPPKSGPLFTFDGQKDEGYALAWSPFVANRVVSGDCANGVYLWEPKEGGGGWTVDTKGFKGHVGSVEDVTFSPGEATVFCSVSSDRTCRMWDVRMKDKSAAWIAAHKTDVNVCAWNGLRQHLLATGADDGSFKVWDLRQFKSHTPAATFTYHQRAITSIEWHPTEDSILATSSEDDSLTVWDLSLETDSDELAKYSRGPKLDADVPPQLFFVHAGQHAIKELHWHKQIPGMLLSTAQDGINIFKPDNLS